MEIRFATAMSSSLTKTLTSPYLLYGTSLFSFTFARFIIRRVDRSGPVSFAPLLIKYNSIFYSAASLLLCLAILHSIWNGISQTSTPSFHSFICTPSIYTSDLILRYLYHASKIYEYVDIFNVLAVGGTVNAHFGLHHFTTPYLTYARVLSYPAGWKAFAALNTLHHAFMYAYFAGAAAVSDILPITGCLQLGIGILVELYVIRENYGVGNGECGGQGGLWANGLAVVLFSTYAVLFSGDLKERAAKKKAEKDD